MNSRTGRLTERQRRFADLYLQLGNASEAAERAGFSRSYAQAAKRQPAVQQYMNRRLREVQSRNVATADEVLAFLTDVMRSGGSPKSDGGQELTGRQAAEMLARRFGLGGIPGNAARDAQMLSAREA